MASSTGKRKRKAPPKEPPEASWSCIACEATTRAVRFDCGHALFCDACAQTHLGMSAEPLCPTCRKPAKVRLFPPIVAREATFEDPAPALAAKRFEDALLHVKSGSPLAGEKVQAYLDGSGDVNAAFPRGKTFMRMFLKTDLVSPTLLLVAASCQDHSKRVELVTLLLEHGAQVTLSNYSGGFTALMLAASCAKNLPLVRLLLERGADVNARNRAMEMYALDYAVDSGSVDIVRELLKRGPSDVWSALSRAEDYAQSMRRRNRLVPKSLLDIITLLRKCAKAADKVDDEGASPASREAAMEAAVAVAASCPRCARPT